MADDKPITKKDLESVIQKVTVQNKATVSIDNAKDIAKPLVEESKKNDLKRLEANIEQRSLFESMYNGIQSIGDNISDGFAELGKSLKQKGANALKFLGIALGAAAGLILAPVFAAGAFFKQISLELKFLNKLTGGRLGKIFAPVTRFFDVISDFFKGSFAKVTSKFANVGKKVKGIARLFKPVLTGLKIGFATVTKFAKLFGATAGKLFLPITIAMTVFDGIKGFLQGFRESDGESMLGKITDGLYGALGEIVANLVGVPLDLLKSGVAWILGKFGFDNAKEALESFSFKDMIKNLVTGVGDMVQKIVDYVVGVFKDPKAAFTAIGENLGNIGEKIKEFTKSILRSFLPVYDESRTGGRFNPLNVAHKLTPNALYKFAGIDKKTGALIPEEQIKANIAASGGPNGAVAMDDLSQSAMTQPIVVVQGATQQAAPSQSNVSLSPTTIMVNDSNRTIAARRRARGRN